MFSKNSEARPHTARLDVDPARRVLRTLLALSFVIAVGSAGFMLIEGWTFWRSLFFTLITITTVGYGAEGLSAAGELFTSILLLGGISTATYSLGVIVQFAVGNELAWRRRMQKQIDRLSGHYIICGFGRIGRGVCSHLAQDSFPFVVVEAEEGHFEATRDRGYLAVHGNATEDETLVAAGIERAAGIVCASASDSDNIVMTLSARQLHPNLRIVARAEDEGSSRKIMLAGANQVISPYRTGATDIAHAISRPNMVDLVKHFEGGFEMSEVLIEEGSPLAGKTIAEFGRDEGSAIVFVAIRRVDGATQFRPRGDQVFEPGDVVIVVSSAGNLEVMREVATCGQLATC